MLQTEPTFHCGLQDSNSCGVVLWSHIHSIALAFARKPPMNSTAPWNCGYLCNLSLSGEGVGKVVKEIRGPFVNASQGTNSFSAGNFCAAGKKENKKKRKVSYTKRWMSSPLGDFSSCLTGNLERCWDEYVSLSSSAPQRYPQQRQEKLKKWRNPNVKGSGAPVGLLEETTCSTHLCAPYSP